MSTTAVTAGQIMDRVANLLNDPNKTDYTYAVQIPYLNMAIEEFSDLMAEANSPLTNATSTHNFGPIVVPAGIGSLYPGDLILPAGIDPNFPRFPTDLLEIQEIGERTSNLPPLAVNPLIVNPSGTYYDDQRPFIRLPRKEFTQLMPKSDSLLYWTWEKSAIVFNPPGASVDMEIQIKYIFQGVPYIANENTIIYMIGSRTYLAYKTAAFCAFFIGENENRAKVMEDRAELAIDRSINISNKGKQEIVTRHRPFRAAYKARGGYY